MYWLLLAAGIQCSSAEVATGSYSHGQPTWPQIPEVGMDTDKHDVVVGYVTSIENETRARYDRLDSKLRALLSANAIAFGLVGGFALIAKPSFLLVALPLLFSVVVALRALGVHKFQSVSLSKQEISREVAELKAIIIRDRVASVNANAGVIDFVGDCLRAAHRYFIASLVAVPFAYGLGLLHSAPPAEVRFLGVDVAQIQGQRGPEGPPGPRGPVGPSARATVMLQSGGEGADAEPD
ncbi:hypothetical protein BH09MYX1_BH09MYX1_11240 [soil metagenome]